MVLNIFDKIIFAVLLLLVFQVPIFSDHYLQFVSGYYEATRQQVDGYTDNAEKHEYTDVYAMIDDFLNNSNPAVRTDGEQKLLVMQEYEELKKIILTLKNGNYFEKAWFIFNPSHWDALGKVLENFKPSIPLAITDVFYSAILALALGSLLIWPIRILIRAK